MRESKKRANKKWRENNKEHIAQYCRERLYGVSAEEWARLSANGCGICGTTEKLVVDHDHTTGKVRGALCNNHNRGIGFFSDDPDLLRRAIAWLER